MLVLPQCPFAAAALFASTASGPGLGAELVFASAELATATSGASASTLDLALTFAIPAALPDWQPAETFPVPELPEPSGIDDDFTRDQLPTDLEAVRWVPGRDVRLPSNEASDQLLIVSPDSLELLATASLVFTSGLTPVPTAGGDGMGGLAVTGVTDRTVHLILANPNDPQCLYVADLTLPNPVTGSLTTTVLAAHPQPAINLSEVMLDWGSRRLFNVHGYGGDRITLLDALFAETAQDIPLPLSSEGASLRRGSLLSGQDLGGTSRMTAAE